jgi:hypothetical protein
LAPARDKLRNSHTNLASFIAAVNPDLQTRYGSLTSKSFDNDAPSLNVLDAAYGENAGAMWLMPQLFAIGEYAGVREKMDEVQTMELAKVIRAKYGFLKVTELLYFFCNLKAGKYGKFYGVVDPMVITEALGGPFMEERERNLKQVEDEKARAERESWHNRPGILKPDEVQALRARLEKQWAEEEEKAKQQNNNQ